MNKEIQISNTPTNIGTTLLAIAFIVLKLTHVINWSWWWVLAPVWGPVAIVVVALLVILVLAATRGRK